MFGAYTVQSQGSENSFSFTIEDTKECIREKVFSLYQKTITKHSSCLSEGYMGVFRELEHHVLFQKNPEGNFSCFTLEKVAGTTFSVLEIGTVEKAPERASPATVLRRDFQGNESKEN